MVLHKECAQLGNLPKFGSVSDFTILIIFGLVYKEKCISFYGFHSIDLKFYRNKQHAGRRPGCAQFSDCPCFMFTAILNSR